jgi:hypothetical protein
MLMVPRGWWFVVSEVDGKGVHTMDVLGGPHMLCRLRADEKGVCSMPSLCRRKRECDERIRLRVVVRGD